MKTTTRYASATEARTDLVAAGFVPAHCPVDGPQEWAHKSGKGRRYAVGRIRSRLARKPYRIVRIDESGQAPRRREPQQEELL